MPPLPNPFKPSPYAVNPTAPIRPVGSPTGAAARLGLGQAPNLAGPVSHAAPSKQPQAQPTSQSKLQQSNNNPGWKMGVNIAAQNATDPVQRMQLMARNIVTKLPNTRSASDHALDRMTHLLSSLVVRPVIPPMIKLALRIP